VKGWRTLPRHSAFNVKESQLWSGDVRRTIPRVGTLLSHLMSVILAAFDGPPACPSLFLCSDTLFRV
jgi:hypothetical protein